MFLFVSLMIVIHAEDQEKSWVGNNLIEYKFCVQDR